MNSKINNKWVVFSGWIGAALGVAGSLLLALNLPYSGYGFMFYLGSNAAWIFHGVKTRTWSMVSMSIGYTAISLLGVFKWVM